MFTGIVEELGTVRTIGVGRIDVACRTVVDRTRVGDSISVNGACLTATEVAAQGFACDVMGETLARTALGDLQPGAEVNLERALTVGSRLGGHLVQGHVDAVAEVLSVEPQGTGSGDRWTVMHIGLPAAVAAYVVEKGSITVDGTSLTVMAVDDGSFSVGLIPLTLTQTVLGRHRPGDRVNLEADVIAKYVERLLGSGAPTPYTGPPPPGPEGP